MQVSETIIYADDFDAAVEFYRDRLGWPVIETGDWGWHLFDAGGAKLGVMKASVWRDEGGLPKPRVAYKADDFDAELAQLRDQGIRVDEPKVSGNLRSTHFYDPSGNAHFLWAEK